MKAKKHKTKVWVELWQSRRPSGRHGWKMHINTYWRKADIGTFRMDDKNLKTVCIKKIYIEWEDGEGL